MVAGHPSFQKRTRHNRVVQNSVPNSVDEMRRVASANRSRDPLQNQFLPTSDETDHRVGAQPLSLVLSVHPDALDDVHDGELSHVAGVLVPTVKWIVNMVPDRVAASERRCLGGYDFEFVGRQDDRFVLIERRFWVMVGLVYVLVRAFVILNKPASRPFRCGRSNHGAPFFFLVFASLYGAVGPFLIVRGFRAQE